MDRDQHQAWLAELAAADLTRREEAERELGRKEAALSDARAALARSEAALRQLEAELNAHRLEADDEEAG